MAFLLDLVVGDWFNASSTWLSFTISGLGGSNRIPCSSCGIVGQTRTYCSNSEAYRYAELIATGDLDSLRLVLFRSRRFVLLACGVLTTRPTFSLPAVANQLLLRVYIWPRDELRRSITLRLLYCSRMRAGLAAWCSGTREGVYGLERRASGIVGWR